LRRTTTAFDADGGRHFIAGEALFRDMAHGAGKGVVQRQAAIVKQAAAQRDLFRTDRIIGRLRQRRQAQRRMLSPMQQISSLAAPLFQRNGAGSVIGLIRSRICLSPA